MNLKRKLLAAALCGSLAAAFIPVYADDDNPNFFVRMAKMCDKAPDGKVTKAQVMDMVGKMFDKADTRKEGKLDKKQAEAFYKMFTGESRGG